MPDTHGSQPLTEDDHPFQLRRIELEYFKSVHRANVTLSPLAVIVGGNSSGKSTLLQPILAICQASKAHGTAEDSLLNGDLQQLGTFHEVQNFRVDQSEERFEESYSQVTSMSRDQRRRITDDWLLAESEDYIRIGFQIVMGQETIDWYMSIVEDENRELFAKITSLEVLITGEDHYEYVSCNSEKQVCVYQLLDETAEARELVPLGSSDILKILRECEQGTGTEWSDSWEGVDPQDSSPNLPSSIVRELSCSEVVFRVNEAFHLTDPEVIQDYGVTQYSIRILDTHKVASRWERTFSINSDWSHTNDDFLSEESNWSRSILAKVPETIGGMFGSRIAYLGPLRAVPRKMARADIVSGRTNLGKQGEYTAAVLDSMRDDRIRVPLPDGYEDQVHLGEAMNRWLKWFGLADDANARRARRSVDLSVNPPGASTSVDLSSVGVGVSQVLPVILLCLMSRGTDVLILEQPELHLHPELQKRMADFLLAFVRAGRQILVETHSDHLVNQLRYQVAADQTDEIRKLVKLIFAEQTDGITTYRESEINEYGGLSEDWPDGFLDISAKSAQDLVRHGLRKWKLRKPRPGDTN